MARADYFATFEKTTGERVELTLSGEDYGLIAEGDLGRLTHQGWAFKEFVRGM